MNSRTKTAVLLSGCTAGILLTSGAAHAFPTTLGVGDISIIGYRSDAADALAFVTWVDLDAGTEIKFTDSGYNGDGTWRATENFMTWNSGLSTIAAGTVVTFSFPDTPGASTDLGSIVSGNMNSTSSDGDQFFAYQFSGAGTGFTSGSAAAFSGSLIFGMSSNTWLTSGLATAQTSHLPAELAAPSANINFASEIDNGQYTGMRSGLANLLDYRALVLDASNWTRSNDSGAIVMDSADFTPVPGPGALALMLTSACVAGGRRRRA